MTLRHGVATGEWILFDACRLDRNPINLHFSYSFAGSQSRATVSHPRRTA